MREVSEKVAGWVTWVAKIEPLVARLPATRSQISKLRRVATASAAMSAALQVELREMPWAEQAWQAYRLEHGLLHYPTLHVTIGQLNELTQRSRWLADQLAARRRRERRKGIDADADAE